MPRKARIDYPGLTHHIMGRTFSDFVLYRDDEDRRVFLELFSSRLLQSGFRCYAWALMDTHYHMLVHTSRMPLWSMMKPLNSDYVRFYNKKHKRRGTLFSDRYKSIATQDQSYLEQIIRYIHLNPVRAGICKTMMQLSKYPWTGHAALMGRIQCPFQDTKTVLRRFGKSKEISQQNYHSFIREGLKPFDNTALEENIRLSNSGKRDKWNPGCWVIGDADFQKEVLSKDRKNRLTVARFKKEGWTLDRLLEFTANKMDIEKNLIHRKSRRTLHADAKKVFCLFARQLGFPTRDTGSFLGIQQAAVSLSAQKGEKIAFKLNLLL